MIVSGNMEGESNMTSNILGRRRLIALEASDIIINIKQCYVSEALIEKLWLCVYM